MKYNSGSPFFFKKDISYVLKEYRKILLGHGTLRMGKFVAEFERNFAQYISVKRAISTSSCTSALETIFNSINLNKNDEIIIPCQTFIASVSTILRFGAKPVIAEIDNQFNLDFDDMKKKISHKTKAVVIVHFAGRISKNILLIKKFLKTKKILLIEDAAHALGANFNGKKAGSIGDISAFSFYSTKIITTGEGGMITTDNLSLSNKCLQFRSRGAKLNSKYEIYNSLGTNHRITEFQGILGLVQLKRIDQFIAHRNSIANTYNHILCQFSEKNILNIPTIDQHSTSSFWRYIIILNKKINRKKIIFNLRKLSIDVINSYEPLIHKQPLFQTYLKQKKPKLNFSENYCKRHIMLPIHFNIKIKDAIYIAKALIKSIKLEI